MRSQDSHKSYKETGGQRTAYFGFYRVGAEQISAGDGSAEKWNFDVTRSDHRQKRRDTKGPVTEIVTMDRHATKRRPRVRRGIASERGWGRADDSPPRPGIP